MVHTHLYAGAIAILGAGFGLGIGPILLDETGCNGSESSLLACAHEGIRNYDCSHFQDAGVLCPGKFYFLLITKQL